MFRRLLILLLVLVLPLQAVAGTFVHVCRHETGPTAPAHPVMAEAAGHAHCQLDVAPDDALADEAAPAADSASTLCDDCGRCDHVAFSLFAMPPPLPVVAFSPVRVARISLTVSSRVPALPDRPPRTAAA